MSPSLPSNSLFFPFYSFSLYLSPPLAGSPKFWGPPLYPFSSCSCRVPTSKAPPLTMTFAPILDHPPCPFHSLTFHFSSLIPSHHIPGFPSLKLRQRISTGTIMSTGIRTGMGMRTGMERTESAHIQISVLSRYFFKMMWVGWKWSLRWGGGCFWCVCLFMSFFTLFHSPSAEG